MLNTSSVVIGAPWTATISPQATRGAGFWIVIVKSSTFAGFMIDLGLFLGGVPGGLSQILVNGPTLGVHTPGAHSGGGTTASYSVAVPFNCALLGTSWAAQSIVWGDLPAGAGPLDPWFSTATNGNIGMY